MLFPELNSESLIESKMTISYHVIVNNAVKVSVNKTVKSYRYFSAGIELSLNNSVT